MNRPQYRVRVFLFSAIACELKIKDVLLSRSADEKRPLVDLLVNNPRDFSMSAASLFDKASKVTFGRSLKEHDKSLFNRVRQLFEKRNKLVHTGTMPDKSAFTYLDMAGEAFEWLSEVANKTID